jgi:hypothetical protein
MAAIHRGHWVGTDDFHRVSRAFFLAKFMNLDLYISDVQKS